MYPSDSILHDNKLIICCGRNKISEDVMLELGTLIYIILTILLIKQIIH